MDREWLSKVKCFFFRFFLVLQNDYKLVNCKETDRVGEVISMYRKILTIQPYTEWIEEAKMINLKK